MSYKTVKADENECDEFFPSFNEKEEAYTDWAKRVLTKYVRLGIEERLALRQDPNFRDARECYSRFLDLQKKVMFSKDLIDKMIAVEREERLFCSENKRKGRV